MVQPHTTRRIFRYEIQAGLVATRRMSAASELYRPRTPLETGKEATMRAFIIACCAAIGLAIGAATMLGIFLQQSSSQAFSTTAVRLD